MAGRLVMLAAMVLLWLAPGAAADHPSQGLETLAGVPAVSVVVADIGPRLRDHGVDREAVRQTVRAALDEAGIATGPEPDAARLQVRLESRVGSRRFLALTIDLALRQHVRLDRDPQKVISATTWSNGAIAPVERGNADAVSERVARFVARTFVPDFRAANRDRP